MRRVVVTGMGAVTPVGNSVAAFWHSLRHGINGICRISRFDTEGFPYQLAAEVKNFEPLHYLDKSTLRKTDLFTQYALCAAGEAMADSGLENQIDGERLGVCFGSGVGGFTTLCAEHEKLLAKGVRKISPLFIPKMIDNIAAGNIAIRYGAHGSCVGVSTACATGTTAVGEGYRSILGGYAEAVICGGSEASILPLSVGGFGNAQTLSPSTDPDKASLPFDKRRRGFVMGEGAGALVLEEYGHAVARGAKIYGEICGYGSTCDAYHVTSPSPHPQYAAGAVREALNGTLDIAASKIYVNAHGTGTVMNDQCETAALKEVFGSGAYDLHISSTKSMTGHMLGAAGAVEAIAALLALRHSLIPPTINLREADPQCDLNYTPNHAVEAPIELALSLSLGFGGHNACIAMKKVEK